MLLPLHGSGSAVLLINQPSAPDAEL